MTRTPARLLLTAAALVATLAACVPPPTPRPTTTTRPPATSRPTATTTSSTSTTSTTTTTAPAAASPRPVGPSGEFTLLFSDDFDGEELADAWWPNRWFADQCSSGAGDPELQWYTRLPENVSVSGGMLHLTARRETYSCGEWADRFPATRQFTSGWVQTGGSADRNGVNAPVGFSCTVGCYVEASVKMPEGALTFPAMWMLPVEDSGRSRSYPTRPEIDVVEFYDRWDSWEHHLHTTCSGSPRSFGETFAGPDSTGGFHTVGMWWRSPSRLEFYVDGRPAWTYTGCGIPGAGVQMYLILNHAVGHAAPNPQPSEPFPKTMLVDYVRAWHGR